MKTPSNEIEYFSNCYKCKKPSEFTLCKDCITEYNKTWYYKISRYNTWPKDLVSGHPIRLFGIYLFTVLKIAKPNYEWECSETYDKGNCRCKKHYKPCDCKWCTTLQLKCSSCRICKNK